MMKFTGNLFNVHGIIESDDSWIPEFCRDYLYIDNVEYGDAAWSKLTTLPLLGNFERKWHPASTILYSEEYKEFFEMYFKVKNDDRFSSLVIPAQGEIPTANSYFVFDHSLEIPLKNIGCSIFYTKQMAREYILDEQDLREALSHIEMHGSVGYRDMREKGERIIHPHAAVVQHVEWLDYSGALHPLTYRAIIHVEEMKAKKYS